MPEKLERDSEVVRSPLLTPSSPKKTPKGTLMKDLHVEKIENEEQAEIEVNFDAI